MRVTAAVHRFINYVKQYEKCDPAAGEIPLKAGFRVRDKDEIEDPKSS